MSLRGEETATQCSAALPTIATTMTPTKNGDSPIDSRRLGDRADEDLRHHADRDAGDRQRDRPTCARSTARRRSSSSSWLGVEEVAVGLQREEQPGDVGERAARSRRATDSCSTVAVEVRRARRPGCGRPPPVDELEDRRHDQRGGGQQQHRATAPLAAVRSKCWRSRLRPPTNIAAPITSRMLPRIEPTSEALTTSCRPSSSAKRAMISSGALPNVTLSRPPMPGPGARGELLGRAAHQRRGRDHAERRGEEDHDRAGVRELEHDRDRDERDQQVRPALAGHEESQLSRSGGDYWPTRSAQASRRSRVRRGR